MASEKMLKFMQEHPCTDETCAIEKGACYVGQWTVHAPHHYEVHGAGVNRHRGKYQVHCPGKTEVTRLR